MAQHYTWSAEVVIPGQGLHDARGAHRSPRPATEDELKDAVARDIASKHRCDPAQIYFTSFAYSEAP